MSSRPIVLTACLACVAVLAGCGLNVMSADLFVLTRTGEGGKLTLLVNDGGTVKCNGAPARRLPDPQLLSARDFAGTLDTDVKRHVHFAADPRSVYRYSVALADGTLTFDDTAASHRPELAQAEQFTLQVTQNTCR